jgi:hypothetical protein
VSVFFLTSTGPLPVWSKELPHFDSDSGGERGAAIDTLVGTAKLNGLDAGVYLRHIIAFIAEHPVNRATNSRDGSLLISFKPTPPEFNGLPLTARYQRAVENGLGWTATLHRKYQK